MSDSSFINVSARASSWTDRWWSVAPDVGIYIGAGCVSTAAVTPSAQRPRLLASHVDVLPEGVVAPSPVESNIRRPDVIIEHLKPAVRRLKGRETAISLPDASVRVTILELAHVPVKREEREALFQHHLEQLFLTPLGSCRFASQRLTAGDGGKHRVLVAAIRKEILAEYEAVVRAVGLRPSMVDLSAFRLFNLYESGIRALFQPGRPGSAEPRLLFLNLFDRNFTMIMADRSGPRLIRIKAFPAAMDQADWLARVLVEIDASLRASDATSALEERSIERLLVFSDRPLDEFERRVREDFHVGIDRLQADASGLRAGGLAPETDGPAANGEAGPPVHGHDHAVTMALAAVGWRVQAGIGSKASPGVMT
ncbi:MAG: pilus assembly protein PilM [Nitrospirae bacterium]|nr:pilus assembly protein PilM [Nitrospirota bacterium]